MSDYGQYLRSIQGDDGAIIVVASAYRDELAFAPSALDFVKFTKRHGHPIAIASTEDVPRSVDLRDDTWYLPAILIVASGDPIMKTAINVALNVISSYLYDRLKGLLPGRKPNARVRLMIRRGEDVLEYEYEGAAADFSALQPETVVGQFAPLKRPSADVSQLDALPPGLPDRARRANRGKRARHKPPSKSRRK